jgi:Flp pilus assembly protein TadD
MPPGKIPEGIKIKSRAYREGLHLNPNDTDAHSELGEILQHLGWSEEAVKEYREI